MSLHEIVLPQTKPETEWVRGRALAKMSPTYRHAALQLVVGGALRAWARGRGRVGSEWRFRVTPPGAITRPLVPDVAYLSYDALAADASDADVAIPACAPTVAVEILSPDDRRPDVDDKIATYLAAGTSLVIVVDPDRERMEWHDADASGLIERGQRASHAALPKFTLAPGDLFDEAAR